jgi:hypothetical protein
LGESFMHELLIQRGYPFERQYRVDRWRIDLALPPLGLEIERDFWLPHQLDSFEPDSFGG